jgi:hypothetical protein
LNLAVGGDGLCAGQENVSFSRRRGLGQPIEGRVHVRQAARLAFQQTHSALGRVQKTRAALKGWECRRIFLPDVG